jgi:hypothetical protein
MNMETKRQRDPQTKRPKHKDTQGQNEPNTK